MSDTPEKKIKKAAALSYEPGEDKAPKVVASGKGVIAEKIIEKAKEARIPVYEDEHLAEALTGIRLGSEIPEELYDVVAEVLAFISRLDGRFSKFEGKLDG
ncbi:MAG TPA: EscU/YscU/HrcU family type III secretion system export apparatus switch protein [Thermoclostridium caenicola]|uniref:Flagellar biosynthesis protein n=1 Tax=Thermoclostridium caenicola TaxID=659425 RepID=A0A1M6IWE2_9FIRM|nr:EscU/YscU/HrcU family type III secretion system export apparatus switch protein [Thermoclostridium caenicola]SHJ38770.1 flagellar biosynthesis protein [Thermoclostridium caenicola]HOK42197.1 EscU/YscU/HrcU family type III secretion system export apparatus switch protein [Thermoclostridium caenicola]HOL85449.1 EscU/YscU/HrcU family type III secretion system export apparatus switch protein [Thermoclostridium caenicola]HPO76777.1 EscU/YscU/HrcU family type III secretion system export apparatus 